MVELVGKYDPFGISWTPYDYGVCSECGGELVLVRYPKGSVTSKTINGWKVYHIEEETDILCLTCGTSVTEKKGEEISYDKNKLMSEINGKVSELNPEKRKKWWVKYYELG